MSLIYESDVTIRWVYGTPMISRTMTVDAETSAQKEIDQRRAAWMVAAQAGDRAAYETLLRDCIPFIKRVARGQGIRPDLIDDVVQETLLTVHRARQTYDPNRSFTAWLGTIARRRAIDGLRRVGRTRTREVYAPLAYENHSDPSGSPDEAVFDIGHTEVLRSAIDKLSVRQREAVEHLALQSQSLAQAATATGRSTGSLRVDWHRALKTLYARLGGKD
ncbi:MAG TPA: RNA polymerase sigma factor [Xanthobacteraceae bacterium]|nr:RNA polymerase sigma factor [Xanthobacteraceae bacterium]